MPRRQDADPPPLGSLLDDADRAWIEKQLEKAPPPQQWQIDAIARVHDAVVAKRKQAAS